MRCWTVMYLRGLVYILLGYWIVYTDLVKSYLQALPVRSLVNNKGLESPFLCKPPRPRARVFTLRHASTPIQVLCYFFVPDLFSYFVTRCIRAVMHIPVFKTPRRQTTLLISLFHRTVTHNALGVDSSWQLARESCISLIHKDWTNLSL